jgi:hypothetical protein
MKPNDDGKATAGFDTFEIPMPAEIQAKITVRVGYFPRRGDDLPGWRAEATIDSIGITCRIAAGRERWHSVVDAVEDLSNHLVDASDRARGYQRRRLATIVAGLTAWAEGFEKQAKKEQPIVVNAKSQKILNSKECKALLEDFRRSYQSCLHRFLELGDKAAAIRDQEAYGELCETFDDWIRSEGFGHTFVYDCIKAARIFRLTAPLAEPLKIVLNRESHYRDFPADVEAREAKKIIARLEHDVQPGEDGMRRPTAKQVKAAVSAVCGANGIGAEKKKPAAARPDVPESIEDEIAAVEKPYGPAEPRAPRLASETITGDYREVVADGPPEPDQDARLEAVTKDATMMISLDKGHRRNTLADIARSQEWLDILRGPAPSDGSDPNYWNGQPNRHARQLAGLAAIVRRLAAWTQPGPPGVEGTGSSPRQDLVTLLHGLAVEISGESTLLHGLTHSTPRTRRAK